MEEKEFQARSEQIEQLVQRVNAFANDADRATAQELLQAVMDLHGTALERMMALIADSGEHGPTLLATLAGEPLISGLLVLYNLHPEDLATRVGRALEKARPFLRSRGGKVELIEIAGGVVRLRLDAHGCASTAEALKEAVENAILEAAPDVEEIVTERAAAISGGAFIPLAKLQSPAA